MLRWKCITMHHNRNVLTQGFIGSPGLPSAQMWHKPGSTTWTCTLFYEGFISHVLRSNSAGGLAHGTSCFPMTGKRCPCSRGHIQSRDLWMSSGAKGDSREAKIAGSTFTEVGTLCQLSSFQI